MKRWIALGALVVIAVIVVGTRAIDRKDPPARDGVALVDRSTRATRDPPEHAPGPAPANVIRAPIHVTRLAPDERAAVAQRIAEARAARAARAAGASDAPAIPDEVDQLDLEHAPTDLRDALQESIPILAECYRPAAQDAGPREAIALMTLRGDPDIGTLVDPDQLTDADGQALDPGLADCLRTTLSSLELPPLRQGQELPIQYTFRFDGQ